MVTSGDVEFRILEPNRLLIENLCDTWRINLNPAELSKSFYNPAKLNLKWEYVGQVPFQVYFHSAGYDQKSKKIFIFGGNTGEPQLPVRINTLSALGETLNEGKSTPNTQP